MPKPMPKKNPKKNNRVPSFAYLEGAVGSLHIHAAQGEGEEVSLPAFSMEAYTGGVMYLDMFPLPVVIDLSGMEIGREKKPVFDTHDPEKRVGHSTSIKITDNTLLVEGVMSGRKAIVDEIVEPARNGFPWQSSVGAGHLSVVEVARGEKITANGKQFEGPLYLVKASRLYEISFVALGGDAETTATVAAGRFARGTKTLEVLTMNFNEWLEEQGFDPAALTEKQAESLKSQYDDKMKAEEEAAAEEEKVEEEEKKVPDEKAEPDAAEAARAKATIQTTVESTIKAERRRVSAIRATCNGEFPDIEAKAIDDGQSADEVSKTVLKAMREKRPTNLNFAVGRADSGPRVIEAALSISGRLPGVEKCFTERELEAAHKHYRGIGIRDVILEAARGNGYSGPGLRSDMRAVLRAAFSTSDISGILSNVANKSLLAGFNSVESAWRKISDISNATDFKTMTRYRLTGNTQYEIVSPDGELKHGTLEEESYTNKIETYGLLLFITRQAIIDDDMGALTTLPQRIGRGAGLKINDIVWTAFLDNAAFFTAARLNYAEGSGTALSLSSLTQAEQLFLDQVDAEGKPVALMPEILLVPTALKVTGEQIYKSAELRDTTASTKTPTTNPHSGKFEVVPSAYLGNAGYSGYSSLAWYLLTNPTTAATIEVAFLNGQESPTVETADANFDVLGIQMRGYHDFGAALAEYRGGVKMKGEA